MKAQTGDLEVLRLQPHAKCSTSPPALVFQKSRPSFLALLFTDTSEVVSCSPNPSALHCPSQVGCPLARKDPSYTLLAVSGTSSVDFSKNMKRMRRNGGRF